MTTATTTKARGTSWLLLQLADGTFPSGGFAHSNGLEAAMVLGGLDPSLPSSGLLAFLDASLHQVGRSALPFVRTAAIDPARLPMLDDAYDSMMPMLAPNRASRTQGRALASAAARVWEAQLSSIAKHTSTSGPAHHAPVFGAIFGALGMDPDDAMGAYLHGAARNVLSAAVRLGLMGPLEAQRLLAERAPLLDAIRDQAPHEPCDAAQTAPLLEIYASLHDRLDGRMFQS